MNKNQKIQIIQASRGKSAKQGGLNVGEIKLFLTEQGYAVKKQKRASLNELLQQYITENCDVFTQEIIEEVPEKYPVAPLDLYESKSKELWQQNYLLYQQSKYQLNKRSYSETITGTEQKNPQIFLVPRRRGGPSYKSYPLKGVTSNDDLYYCEMSKGFRFADLSPFVIGPILGQGLNILNSCWSKKIVIEHLDGSGRFDRHAPNFWRVNPMNKKRNIEKIDSKRMSVDGKIHLIGEWLEENKAIWYSDWLNWSKHVSLCGEPSWKWLIDSTALCYLSPDYYPNLFQKNKTKEQKYLNHSEWKDQCYARWLWEKYDKIEAFSFIRSLFHQHHRTIVIVHPIVTEHQICEPVTVQTLKERRKNNSMMNAPFVLAAKLLGFSFF